MAAEPDFDKHFTLAAAFLDWIEDHHVAFMETAAATLFDFEVVVEEDFIEDADDLDEETFNAAADAVQADLAKKLKINDVNVYGGGSTRVARHNTSRNWLVLKRPFVAGFQAPRDN